MGIGQRSYLRVGQCGEYLDEDEFYAWVVDVAGVSFVVWDAQLTSSPASVERERLELGSLSIWEISLLVVAN